MAPRPVHNSAVEGNHALRRVLFIRGLGVATIRRRTMIQITAAECRAKASMCKEQAHQPEISSHDATVLRDMSRSWTALAGQIDRLEADRALREVVGV